MPQRRRHRLHGTTQARRKKPGTRLLKLKGSVERTHATQQHAPFERSERLEREDLEFLEAMRELEVQRSPWSGEAPARRDAADAVQFAEASEDDKAFWQAMDSLGVRPLDGERERDPTRPPVTSSEPDRADVRAGSNGRAPTRDSGTAPAAATERPRSAGAREPSLDDGKGERDALPDSEVAVPPAAGAVRFESGSDDAALLAALLEGGSFRPELKFAGATPPPIRSRTQPSIDRSRLEPDSELDLHHKTLEEAIRMVQNYLLVSHRQRLRHVLIITGKGLNSGEGGGVLREAVYRWLERNGGRFVREFDWAPARHGGKGAIWVTLR